MDERQLNRALKKMEVPASDENAKKRALNLAMAEFDTVQKENEKNFQGVSFLGRLMGSSNKNKRKKPMTFRRKFAYGGSVIALSLAVFVATSSFETQPYRSAGSVGGNNFGNIAQNMSTPKFSPFGKLRGEKKDKTIPRRIVAQSELSSTPGEEQKREYRLADRSRQRMAEAESYEMDAVAGTGAIAPVPQTAPAERQIIAQNFSAEKAAGDAIAGGRVGIMPVPVDDLAMPNQYKDAGRDKFEDFAENPVVTVNEAPVSTFSIDVDTSSYAFIRRQLNHGVLPQKDAVRIEEMINYFDYDYPLPETREQPFQPAVTVAPSPWTEGKKLIHIGIKGYDIDKNAAQPRSNLVFLLDVSGSMNAPDKLPLLKNSMRMLLDSLQPDDTVAIVTYAGAAGTVLEPTAVKDKHKIISALENLRASGSTAGAEGIRQAYNLAESTFNEEAVNRVILATDGDFNVGITNREELKDFIERKRKTGIFLSVLGFGQGNYNDHLMQELAQNGNGVAAYIDNLNEARKVLVDEATSTLFPIAKDVKIQVEFNPATVAEYRLIGYETRHLEREDFNNDAVDAGDIGAGHSVTAIYEITPVGGRLAVDESRYAQKEVQQKSGTAFNNEYAFLKIRYKLPNEDTSKLITTPITTANEHVWQLQGCPADAVCETSLPLVSDDTAFATAVAGLGQILKGGKYIGQMDYDDVIELAVDHKGTDAFGYRAEFVNLVRIAKNAADLQKN